MVLNGHTNHLEAYLNAGSNPMRFSISNKVAGDEYFESSRIQDYKINGKNETLIQATGATKYPSESLINCSLVHYYTLFTQKNSVIRV